MKKTILLLTVAILSSTVLLAQERTVRMPQKPKRAAYVDHTADQQGFWIAVEGEAGSSVIFQHKNVQRAGATVTAGWRFGEYLRAGIGTGANYYFNNNDALRRTKIEWTMPIFVNARGNILSQVSRTAVPYWSVNVGGAIRDGFFFSPSLGMRFGSSRDAWLLGVGYSVGKVRAWECLNSTVNFVSLKFGYEF